MTSSALNFSIKAVSGAARAGTLTTPHGEVKTPFFMPVGTLAAVKGITPAVLQDVGAQIILANTYHLAVRPGEELVRDAGGVAAFMGWNGPMLTDSGGYQIFSLATARKITDEGARFNNHFDGAELFLTPEKAIDIQQKLGPDIMMVLDECPPANATGSEVAQAVQRTRLWAERCMAAWQNRDTQGLFAIVQGGRFESLRRESLDGLVSLDFPGYAIGGVSVGEDPEVMEQVVCFTAPLLPEDKPRYLMGVGRPEDMLRAIGHGVDMFDCVMPTRHARHGQAFTENGTLNIKNSKYKSDNGPLEDECDCYACKTVSRSYLRHLFVVKEMLGPIYISIHNLRFYLRMMAEAREAIHAGRYSEFAAGRLEDIQPVSGGY